MARTQKWTVCLIIQWSHKCHEVALGKVTQCQAASLSVRYRVDMVEVAFIESCRHGTFIKGK